MSEKMPIVQWLRALAEQAKQFGRMPNYDGEIHARLNEAADALRTHENGGQALSAVAVVIDSIAAGIINGKRQALPFGMMLYTAPPSAQAI